MFFRSLGICLIGLVGIASAQDDLPLPKSVPAPVSSGALLKPSLSVQPPSDGTGSPAEDPLDARTQALRAMEQKLIDDQIRRQMALEAQKGDASALKQLIVMLGPVDASLCRGPKPPVASKDRIALIGLAKGKMAIKSLDQFFGAPLTPQVQREILDNVKSQMAAKGKPDVEVKVAGWWPTEGVMAVTVAPKG